MATNNKIIWDFFSGRKLIGGDLTSKDGWVCTWFLAWRWTGSCSCWTDRSRQHRSRSWIFHSRNWIGPLSSVNPLLVWKKKNKEKLVLSRKFLQKMCAIQRDWFNLQWAKRWKHSYEFFLNLDKLIMKFSCSTKCKRFTQDALINYTESSLSTVHDLLWFYSFAVFILKLTHRSEESFPPLTDTTQHWLKALRFPIKHEHALTSALFLVGLQIGAKADSSFQNFLLVQFRKKLNIIPWQRKKKIYVRPAL